MSGKAYRSIGKPLASAVLPTSSIAWASLELGTVIGISRRCGVAHHLIGGCCIAEIDKLARQRATLAPPLVGVLTLQILLRRGERQFDRSRNVLFGRHDASVK